MSNQESCKHTRRDFLSGITMGSGLLLAGCNRGGETGEAAAPGGPADVTLRIGPALVDIAKDHTISTIGYNGAGSRAGDPVAGGRRGDG